MSIPLERLLQNAPWRLLHGIARHAAQPFHHHQPRAGLIRRLGAALMAPKTLEALVASLTPEARDLLVMSLSVSDSVTETWLEAAGGAVRPLSYDRVADAPWQAPKTCSEALVYRGLLLPYPDGESCTYHVAAELAPKLRALLVPPARLPLPRVDGTPPPAPFPPLEALRHDLVMLLLHLHWQRPPALAGHRLRLADIHILRPLLAVSEPNAPIRSHTQAPRLWFLATLARQAGLAVAPPGGHWALTVAGLAWLTLTPEVQIARLWQAWEPGAMVHWPPRFCPPEWRAVWEVPADLRGALRAALGMLPPEEWVARAAWEALDLRLLVPTEANLAAPPDAPERARAHRILVDQLLPGLTGLGLLLIDPAADALHLTPEGAAWADGASPTLPAQAAPVPWQRDHDTLLVPWPAAPGALWRLAPFARPLRGGATLAFELTARTVAVGLSQGLPVGSLQRALAAGGLALTADLLPHRPAPRLRQALWLETAGPAQMSELRADPAVRRALAGGESLDPRRHTVDPRRVAPLQGALAALGQPAVVEVPPSSNGRPRPGAEPAAALLLACRLWQREVARLERGERAAVGPAPLLLPAALLADLAAGLVPEEQAAAEALWVEMLRLLDPVEPWPPPVASEPDDGARHLPSLQQAIDQNRPVRLLYEAAGEPVAERVVEPHFLESRRGRWYLNGHCRKAAAVRTFRLDRIRALTMLAAGQ